MGHKPITISIRYEHRAISKINEKDTYLVLIISQETRPGRYSADLIKLDEMVSMHVDASHRSTFEDFDLDDLRTSATC
jgi:hypothetical protein